LEIFGQACNGVRNRIYSVDAFDDSEKIFPSKAYQISKEDITHLVNNMKSIGFKFPGE
jgi:hypothetical protein